MNDVTLFDFITIVKDTEKPFILSFDTLYEKYTYKEIATDNELLDLKIAGIRVETFEGRPSYIIRVRGLNDEL